MKKLLTITAFLAGMAVTVDAAFLVSMVRRQSGPGFGNGNTHYNIWNTGQRLDSPLADPLTTAQGTFSWNINSVSEWDTIDFGGGGGNFNFANDGGNQGDPAYGAGSNRIYPDGTVNADLGQFSIRAWTKASFPEGDYTIGWGSDDGGFLHLQGASWLGVGGGNTSNMGTTGLLASDVNGVGDDMLWHGTGRGHGWNIASFTVPAGGFEAQLFVSMWEGGGGDSFEIAIKDSHDLTFGGIADGWRLLHDGQFGIELKNDFGLVPEPSTSYTIFLGLGVLAFFRRLKNEMNARRYSSQVE